MGLLLWKQYADLSGLNNDQEEQGEDEINFDEITADKVFFLLDNDPLPIAIQP